MEYQNHFYDSLKKYNKRILRQMLKMRQSMYAKPIS